jgi:hypothetical protein
MAFLHFDQTFGGAFIHEVAPFLSPFRAQVDDPVGRFDDLHIVFHHQHAVAFFHQCVDGVEQFLDVVKMKSGSGLVEYKKDVSAGIVANQERCQFDTLGLAARQGADDD